MRKGRSGALRPDRARLQTSLDGVWDFEEGAFRPKCTTLVSFIERSEVERQAWTRVSWNRLSIAYPSVVFHAPARKPKELSFKAPGIWASSMAGQRQAFGIDLQRTRESAPEALRRITGAPGSWQVDDTGPMIAAHRGIELQRGIEGVGEHFIVVEVEPGETLITAIRVGGRIREPEPHDVLGDAARHRRSHALVHRAGVLSARASP